MKRRLLAFLLAFVMTFSLVPVNTFAAEADAAAHYTKITTESGENVTVEYVETVVGVAAWGQSINTPYYHVTIPEGTEKVLLTYPESVNLVLSGDDGAVFFYRNTYPGQSTIDLGGALTVATNNDGSKTVTIPVENFMLSTDGSVAVGMAYYVDEENQSAAEFFDFTYAAPTHAVTLTSGEGYTLTGEATVEDGKDYSFTVTIADDYEMEDNFVVKANGETLTAGESGSYTVENVTADLTVTVEGVVKKQAAGHAVTLTPGEGYTAYDRNEIGLGGAGGHLRLAYPVLRERRGVGSGGDAADFAPGQPPDSPLPEKTPSGSGGSARRGAERGRGQRHGLAGKPHAAARPADPLPGDRPEPAERRELHPTCHDLGVPKRAAARVPPLGKRILRAHPDFRGAGEAL